MNVGKRLACQRVANKIFATAAQVRAKGVDPTRSTLPTGLTAPFPYLSFTLAVEGLVADEDMAGLASVLKMLQAWAGGTITNNRPPTKAPAKRSTNVVGVAKAQVLGARVLARYWHLKAVGNLPSTMKGPVGAEVPLIEAYVAAGDTAALTLWLKNLQSSKAMDSASFISHEVHFG